MHVLRCDIKHMNITQEQLDILTRPVRRKLIKLDLLDSDYQVINSLETIALENSSGLESNSNDDIRKGATITIVVPRTKTFLDSDESTLLIEGNVWLEKYINIQIGIVDYLNDDEVTWYNEGIVMISKPVRSFDGENNTLAFTCTDLMTKLTANGNGQLTGIGTMITTSSYIPKEDGSVELVRSKTYDALITTITQIANLPKYVVYPIPAKYEYIPYDIKVTAGQSVYDLLKQFINILIGWEMHFDNDGVFIVEPIPSGEREALYPLNNSDLMQYTVDYNLANVKNRIVVYGRVASLNYFTENSVYIEPLEVRYSGNTLILTYSNITAEKIKFETTFGFRSPLIYNDVPTTRVQIFNAGNTTAIFDSPLSAFENYNGLNRVEAMTIYPNKTYFIKLLTAGFRSTQWFNDVTIDNDLATKETVYDSIKGRTYGISESGVGQDSKLRVYNTGTSARLINASLPTFPQDEINSITQTTDDVYVSSEKISADIFSGLIPNAFTTQISTVVVDPIMKFAFAIALDGIAIYDYSTPTPTLGSILIAPYPLYDRAVIDTDTKQIFLSLLLGNLGVFDYSGTPTFGASISDNFNSAIHALSIDTNEKKVFASGSILPSVMQISILDYSGSGTPSFGSGITTPLSEMTRHMAIDTNEKIVFCATGGATADIAPFYYSTATPSFGSLISNTFNTGFEAITIDTNIKKVFVSVYPFLAASQCVLGVIDYNNTPFFSDFINIPSLDTVAQMVIDTAENKIYIGGNVNYFGRLITYNYSSISSSFGSLLIGNFTIGYNDIGIDVIDKKIFCVGGENFTTNYAEMETLDYTNSPDISIFNKTNNVFDDSLKTNYISTKTTALFAYNDTTLYCGGNLGDFAINTIGQTTFEIKNIDNPFYNFSGGAISIDRILATESTVFCFNFAEKLVGVYNVASGLWGLSYLVSFAASEILTDMAQDTQNIYIVGNQGGFIIFNKATFIFSNIISTPFADLQPIFSVAVNNDNTYIGTSNGRIALLEKKTNQFGEIQTAPELFDFSVLSMTIDNSGNVFCVGSWTATNGSQVVSYNAKNPTIVDFDNTSAISFQFMGKQQVSASITNENKNSPFYINKNIKEDNFYLKEILGNPNFDYVYNANLPTDFTALTDGMTFTYFVNRANDSDFFGIEYENTKMNLIDSGGGYVFQDEILYENKIVNGVRSPIGKGTMFDDFTLYSMTWNEGEDKLIFNGAFTKAIPEVLKSGEYDNIPSDALAQDRCEYELYLSSNLQDSVTLSIFPDYGIQINDRVRLKLKQNDDVLITAKGTNPICPILLLGKGGIALVANQAPSFEYLIKTNSIPLNVSSGGQSINAIRIFEDENIIGKNY